MSELPHIDRLVRTNRKTIAIIVRPDGLLEIRAPKRAALAQIHAFVASKADWIEKYQGQARDRVQHIPARRFVDGEPVLYLGKAYPLRLDRSVRAPRLTAGCLLFPPLPAAQAEAALIHWYQRAARTVFTQRTPLAAQRTGLNYSTIRINSAVTRWGSCGSHDSLNFTYRLVMAPLERLDYVILHELAHTRERNHGPDFWNLVAGFDPDYRTSINWLSRNGRLLKVEYAADESAFQAV